MRTRTQTLLAAAALLAMGAAPARGQNAAVDRRWFAYLGCWERVEAAKSHICVVPTADPTAVDLVTIVKGEVTVRERIDASGAEWSPRGVRLYLRSEDNRDSRDSVGTGTGLIAMTGTGDWLYIQGMTVAGQTGVRVQRYREASSELLLPDDIAAAVRLNVSSTLRARAAAGAPLSTDDVVEAIRHLDTPVLEAWLVERAQPFRLDAKRLIALADAGVPSRVIDLMVALSYPRVFAINSASRQGERLASTSSYGLGTAPSTYVSDYDPVCYGYDYMDPYTSYECSGRLYGYGYRYGYGYGWYPGDRPITIIYGGSSGGGSSRQHGKFVNGQGYVQGDANAEGRNAMPRPSVDAGSRPSSGTSGSTGAAAPSTSSSSGSSGQRTAQPRKPQ